MGPSTPAEEHTTRFLYPEPRVRTGLLLGRNRAATACIDLSDGVADGVRRLAEASGVGAIIEADELPIDADTRAWFSGRGLDPIAESLSGGDDYELLFAVRPRVRHRLRAVARESSARDDADRRVHPRDDGRVTADRRRSIERYAPARRVRHFR